RPVADRRRPRAMPDRLEASGAADQGDRGRTIGARRAASPLLMIEDFPDHESFRVAPSLVVVTAERNETIENDVARLDVDNVELGPLHERADLVKAADQKIAGASRLSLVEQLICIDVADRTGIWRTIK